MKAITLTAGLLCILFTAVSATPFTHSSMIDMPTAYLLPHTRLDVSGNFYLPYPHGASEELILYFGLYDRGEIGLSLPVIQYKGTEHQSTSGTVKAYLHGKYQVFRESRIFPAMAVGVVNLGSDGDLVDIGKTVEDGIGFTKDFQSNSLYFVFSKQMLVRPIYDRLIYCDVHLGMGIRRFVGDTPLARSFHGIFAGADVYLNEKLNLMLEQDGNDFNMGIQYVLRDNLAIRGAWVKFEEVIQEDHPFPNLGIGIRYTMGPFQGKRKAISKLYSIEDRRAFLMKGAVDIHEDTLKLIIQMNKLKKQRQMLEGKLKGLKSAVEELKKGKGK